MNKGKIDNPVFSIYTNVERNKKSWIKFGGYDEKAIKKGENLTYFKTLNSSSWELEASVF